MSTVSHNEESRFFTRLVAGAVVGAVVLFGATVGVRRVVCAETVDTRDDARSVWIYLIETSADPESERVGEFVEFMDHRLPALECSSWGTPKEVES
jgi:hypothetical protein